MTHPPILYVQSPDGQTLRAQLRWGEAEIDTPLYKLEAGPLLFLQADGRLIDTSGNVYIVVGENLPPPAQADAGS